MPKRRLGATAGAGTGAGGPRSSEATAVSPFGDGDGGSRKGGATGRAEEGGKTLGQADFRALLLGGK
jgi:hypothetical protein